MAPWPKCKSGNPAGRPKRQDSLAAWLRRIGRTKLDPDADHPRGRTRDRAVIEALFTAALAGDLTAIRLILEFRLGKPPIMEINAQGDIHAKLYISISPDDWPGG